MRWQRLSCCSVLWIAAGCATFRGGPEIAPAVAGEQQQKVPEARDVETRVFLIGDAGVPLVDDPVLGALSKEVAADPRRSVVVFLGDNVYPRGLPPAESVGRKEAERRLDAQISAARHEGATVIFVPGNHDWDRMGPGGLAAVRRQGEYVRHKGGEHVMVLPENGCPGPVVRDVNTRLRLILLDTQWWLQPASGKPHGPKSGCTPHSEPQVLDALGASLREANGRHVVIAAHHPLASGGTHGGYFSWRDHLFPLRARKSWLWIPLPGIGSAYPLARIYGRSDQDLAGPGNRKMREALSGTLEKSPPLVYAAGHEHSLQVLEGPAAKYLLVSGTGAFGHITRTVWTTSTLFAAALSGYMRLDVERGGRVRLAVVTLDPRGKASEAAAFELSAPPEVQKPVAPPPPGAVVEPPKQIQQQTPEQKPGVPESQKEPQKPPEKKPETEPPKSEAPQKPPQEKQQPEKPPPQEPEKPGEKR